MRNQHESASSDDERPDVFRYSALIRYAKLLRNEKHLLRFYADVHNWKTGRWSEYSTHRICSLVSMSTKTFREARSNLEDLGWIVIHWRGDRTTPTIQLRIGRDDPRYDNKEWADWWLPEGGYSQEFSGNPFDSAPSMGVEGQRNQMEEFTPLLENALSDTKKRKVSFKPVETTEEKLVASDDGLRVSSLAEW